MLSSLLPRRNSPSRVCCAAALWLALGCSAADPQADTAAAGTGGAPIASSVALTFQPAGTLALSPEEEAELAVKVVPANSQLVTFEILSSEAVFDGYLLTGSSRVDATGIARAALHAPSLPATFMVRASLETGQQTQRVVSVSSLGYGTIMVSPIYDGDRAINLWTASAQPGVSCEESELDWSDGPLRAESDSQPILDLVPSGVTLAVTLRGDQLVSGCTTVTNLAQDALLEIELEVNDRPLEIEKGTLAVTLGVNSTTSEFALHLERAIEDALNELRSEQNSDSEALIEWMAKTFEEDERQAFRESAKNADIAALIDKQWPDASDPLSDQLGQLLTEAAESIPGDDTFSGELTLGGSDSEFALQQAAGIRPEAGGFAPPASWTVAREAGDSVFFGGDLSYSPLRWLSEIANQQTPVSELLEKANCPAISQSIDSSLDSSLIEGCGANCMNELCEQAIYALWNEIASNPGLSTLQVSASCGATLLGEAEISELQGMWIGRLTESDDDSQSALGGEVKASRVSDEAGE